MRTVLNKSAAISEIFSSLQGEGTHIGERHLFVRFERCNIHCGYCDELDKIGGELNLDTVLNRVKQIDHEEGPHTFVSLTGGEPLVYVSFLKELCPKLRELGFKIYLETNGILVKPLQDILQWIDVIAMDMKPASVTKEQNFFSEHLQFLKISSAREVFVKLVLSKEIDADEFEQCCRIIRAVDPRIPLILQPISLPNLEGHEDRELVRLLCELQKVAAAELENVRIVPRLHRILKIK